MYSRGKVMAASWLKLAGKQQEQQSVETWHEATQGHQYFEI